MVQFMHYSPNYQKLHFHSLYGLPLQYLSQVIILQQLLFFFEIQDAPILGLCYSYYCTALEVTKPPATCTNKKATCKLL